MNDFPISRRRLLGTAGLAASAVALPGCAGKVVPVPTVADDSALLDSLPWRLLETEPDLATTPGVDPGATPPLRNRQKGLRTRFQDQTLAWYGAQEAEKVQYVEAFEICEYGRRPDKSELKQLFPFLP